MVDFALGDLLLMGFYPIRSRCRSICDIYTLNAPAPALGCFGASNAPGRVISSQSAAGETDPLPVRRQTGRA